MKLRRDKLKTRPSEEDDIEEQLSSEIINVADGELKC
jgi:hypothetical protein